MPGANILTPDSSEMGWNFQTPIYRMVVGYMNMVYVNFKKKLPVLVEERPKEEISSVMVLKIFPSRSNY